jgi:hypothetical protein
MNCIICVFQLSNYFLLGEVGLPITVGHKSVARFGVIVVAMVVALNFDEHFASACSLVGSISTFTNSVILPLIFYHTVLGDNCSTSKKYLHISMLLIACLSASFGIINTACDVFGIEECSRYFFA